MVTQLFIAQSVAACRDIGIPSLLNLIEASESVETVEKACNSIANMSVIGIWKFLVKFLIIKLK